MVFKKGVLMLLAAVIIFSGCTESRDPCTDGVKSPGEEGVDCGGGCPPCSTTTFANPKKDCKILPEPGKSECLAEKALKEMDAGVCDDITIDFWRQSCVIAVASEGGYPGLCEILEDQLSRDTCYKKVAVDAEIPSACQNISLESDRDTCHYRLAQETRNMTLCSNIVSESSSIRCKAVFERDWTICRQLGNNDAGDYCVLKVVGMNATSEACLFVTNEDIKEQCYTTTAEKLIDKRLCEKSGSLREECLFRVDQAQKKLDKLNEGLGNMTFRIEPSGQ